MRSIHSSLPRPGSRASELIAVALVTTAVVGALHPFFDGRAAGLTARDRERQSACSHNLRTIGLAMAAYVDDWGGIYPAWSPPGSTGLESAEDFKATYENRLYMGGTINTLAPSGAKGVISLQLAGYIKDRSVWACPADFGMFASNDDWSGGTPKTDLPFKRWRLSGDLTKEVGVSYGYRGTNLVSQDDPILASRDVNGIALAGYPVTAVVHPDLRLMFWDHRAWHGSTKLSSIASRRTANVEVLFIDGHAGSLTQTEFNSSTMNPWIDFRK